MNIQLKRAYEPPAANDGFRILVDRLWPRGLKKNAAKIDLWLKEISPSPELRRWFRHDPDKWEVFRSKYFNELETKPDLLQQIVKHTKEGVTTLIYSAKDSEYNNAVALREFLINKVEDMT